MSRELKLRPDGQLNITVSPEAQQLLDTLVDEASTELGVKLTRSQGITYILKQYKKLKGDTP